MASHAHHSHHHPSIYSYYFVWVDAGPYHQSHLSGLVFFRHGMVVVCNRDSSWLDALVFRSALLSQPDRSRQGTHASLSHNATGGNRHSYLWLSPQNVPEFPNHYVTTRTAAHDVAQHASSARLTYVSGNVVVRLQVDYEWTTAWAGRQGPTEQKKKLQQMQQIDAAWDGKDGMGQVHELILTIKPSQPHSLPSRLVAVQPCLGHRVPGPSLGLHWSWVRIACCWMSM